MTAQTTQYEPAVTPPAEEHRLSVEVSLPNGKVEVMALPLEASADKQLCEQGVARLHVDELMALSKTIEKYQSFCVKQPQLATRLDEKAWLEYGMNFIDLMLERVKSLCANRTLDQGLAQGLPPAYREVTLMKALMVEHINPYIEPYPWEQRQGERPYGKETEATIAEPDTLVTEADLQNLLDILTEESDRPVEQPRVDASVDTTYEMD